MKLKYTNTINDIIEFTKNLTISQMDVKKYEKRKIYLFAIILILTQLIFGFILGGIGKALLYGMIGLIISVLLVIN